MVPSVPAFPGSQTLHAVLRALEELQCDHLGMESQNGWAGRDSQGPAVSRDISWMREGEGLRETCSQSGASGSAAVGLYVN